MVDPLPLWWRMAEEALQSARMEREAGFLHSAINRAYYAVFYAATAALVDQGLEFKKHSGVRAALHREFVKKGLLSQEIGVLYDRLFEDRKHGAVNLLDCKTRPPDFAVTQNMPN